MKVIYSFSALLLLGSALARGPQGGPRPYKRKEAKVSLESQEWLQKYTEGWARVAELASKNATVAKMVDKHFQTFNQKPEVSAKTDFNCDLPPSRFPPDNAHSVRPSDIKAIAAIGDSITAGFGITAESLIQMVRNDRHQAWVSGGINSLDEGMITLPNILRLLSPTLSGYAFAESWPDELEAGLNVAFGGAIATDMYENAYELVDKMWYSGSEIGVDWYEDWKLVSFLIGGNDLCRFCNDPEYYSPDAYVNNIRIALDYLKNEGPPRQIVVLSTIFDITSLPAFSDSLVCDVFQWVACPCAFDSDYHPMIRQAQKDYHEKLVALVESGRYDDPNRPDFTVVMMPHFKDAVPPKIPGTDQVDSSFWAVDCFHPGRKAHYAMAVSLWNQMFEPEGQRRTELDWSMEGLTCPTAQNPFIQTRLNGPPPDKKTVNAFVADNSGAVVGGSLGGLLAICMAVGAVVGVKL